MVVTELSAATDSIRPYHVLKTGLYEPWDMMSYTSQDMMRAVVGAYEGKGDSSPVAAVVAPSPTASPKAKAKGLLSRIASALFGTKRSSVALARSNAVSRQADIYATVEAQGVLTPASTGIIDRQVGKALAATVRGRGASAGAVATTE